MTETETSPVIPQSPPPKPNLKIPGVALGILIGIVVTLTGVFAYFRFTTLSSSTVPTPTPPRPTVYIAPRISLPIQPTITPTSVPAKLNLGQVSWLPYPTLIKPLSVFRDDKEALECVKNSNFQQIGTFADGSKLINHIYTDVCGMGENQVLSRLVQSPNGHIYRINQTYLGYYLPTLEAATVSIAGLETPEFLDTKYGQFKSSSFFFDQTISFTELTNPKLVTETPFGNLYVEYSDKADTHGLYGRYFYLRLRDDTVSGYSIYANFLTDDQVPLITWNDNSKNSNQFISAPQGKCGGSGYDVLRADSPLVKNLAVTGYLPDQTPVYQFTSIDHPLIKLLYEQYPATRYENGNQVDNPKMSVTDFLNGHSHFLWQDSYHDWHLYSSEKYSLQAECAKPVIYLYPQVDTTVSVQVAADITQSDPIYPQNGWTVLAHPNGQLTYQNKIYPYLFWEGMGRGVYNSHPGEGFVVAQKNLTATLYHHLKLLGLNPQESADFMEFWLPKLPTTPYVRLTWLDTADMNTLAPLSVSPRPNTAIRLFLEFGGLDQPIILKPQNLSSPPRRGFTLVEWGGLLLK